MVSLFPLYVVDASVAGRWHLRDEGIFQRQCDLVIQRYVGDQLKLIAPDCLVYEFGSLISAAARDKRISVEHGRQILRAFQDWYIDLMPTEGQAQRALELSVLYDHPIYDCYYMALAESLRRPYIHADEVLHRKLNGRFAFELWIGNYA